VAYFNFLASVSEPDLERVRTGRGARLRPSLVLGTSHLLAYWVKVQPLGELLHRALDGGEPIRDDLWHPLRPPLFHRPAMVRGLAQEIDAAWSQTRRGEPLPAGDWIASEIERLLRLFGHAAEAGECVVSALEPPLDAERGRRVRLLW
jgi:hypothetical protein